MARWAIDSLLMAEGERCTDFQLPLKSGNDVIQYPGNTISFGLKFMKDKYNRDKSLINLSNSSLKVQRIQLLVRI